MSGLDTQVQIGVGDDSEVISLGQLADLDVSQIEPNYGFAPTPAGTYHFRCKNAELTTIEIADESEGAEDGAKMVVPIVIFDLQVIHVESLSDKSLDPSAYLGWEHQERVRIRDAGKDTGKCRALMENAGLQWNGKFRDLLDQFVGTEFVAVITNNKDKNNADKIWANLDRKKVKPLHSGAGMVAPPAAAAPAPAAPARGQAFSLSK